jgi:hypothetical protein
LGWGKRPCPLCRCGRCSMSSPQLSSSSCRGGERGSDGRDDWIRARRFLPEGCYGATKLFRPEQALILVDNATFGRHGGPTTTSKSEALFCLVRWGSALLRQQVTRSSPEEEKRPVDAKLRRKRAAGQFGTASRRKHLEIAGVWWRWRPGA